MNPKLDLVIFGATGFSGIVAVAEVHRISKNDKNLTWGISGRSQSKLDKVINDLKTKTGEDLQHIRTIVADVNDPESLPYMTKQARVILNCCGPYHKYGEPVIKACIETKTHHVDLSGEPIYMESMEYAHNEAAKKAGIYIISACAFDSIPADMGIVYAQKHFKGQLNSAEVFFSVDLPSKYQKLGEPQANIGTWESIIPILAKSDELKKLRKKLYPEPEPKLNPKLKSRGIFHKNEIDGRWYLPLPFTDYDVVKRSQRFLSKQNNSRPVQMKEYIGFPNILMLFMVTIIGFMVNILTRFSFGTKLLLDHPKLFSFGFFSHTGPSEDVMKHTTFYMNIYAEGWDEVEKEIDGSRPTKNIVVQVCGTNPGYGAAVTALICSGMTILREAEKMPGVGGVLPPGFAFANTSLIEKLNENNITFEVVSVDGKAKH